jgi:hypothetical protein
MSATAHIVLLLAIARDPASETIAHLTAKAAATPFVEPPRIELRIVPRPPTPGEIDTLAHETAAERVVVMTCTARGCGRAELHATGEGGEGLSRAIHFEPVDEPTERGRALGLLVSTLLPDGWSRIQPAPDPAATATASTAAAAVPAIAAVAPTASSAASARWGLETEIALLMGSPGDVSDGGITLTLNRHLAGGWATRAGLKFELGDLPIAGGTSKALGAVLGVGWTSASLSQPHRFGFGARADLLGLARFERLSVIDDGMNEVESRDMLALGADVMALVGFSLAERTSVLAGVGGEYLSDVTKIGGGQWDDAPVAGGGSPHPFRLTFQVGVLSRF